MTMKLFLPKQHGAWAMLIIPFWLGVFASQFKWLHIPLFLGWVFLYLATYPMLLLCKRKKKQQRFYAKWTAIYLGISLLLLSAPLVSEPGLFMFALIFLPFFLLNGYYSSVNKDRALTNDISAIAVFCLAGVASHFFGAREMHNNGFHVAAVSFLFFLGSTFYVKTMIREKKNASFKTISWGYHGLVVLFWAFTGNWLVLLAFTPSLVRAIAFYGRKLSVMKVGIYEILNAVIFFLVMAVEIFKEAH